MDKVLLYHEWSLEEASELKRVIQGTPIWLGHRPRFIGASDFDVLLCYSKYTRIADLARKRLGLIKADQTSSIFTEHGHTMEPVIAEMVSDLLKLDLYESGMHVSTSRPEFSFCAISPDRLVSGEDALVEIKAPFYAVHDKVPDGYFAQCQVQMGITGCKKVYFSSYCKGVLKVWKIDFDEPYFERIMTIAREFVIKLKAIEQDEKEALTLFRELGLVWGQDYYEFPELMEHLSQVTEIKQDPTPVHVPQFRAKLILIEDVDEEFYKETLSKKSIKSQ
jgi:hypothetical protein